MLVDRLREAIDGHDVESLVECFDLAYRSEQPAHPARSFHGQDQVRKNWAALFQEIPDLRADLLDSAAGTTGTEWGEWRWHGTRRNGTHFEMKGVTVFGIRCDHIVWGRLYMEEVEHAGKNIDQAVRKLSHARETPDDRPAVSPNHNG